MTWIEYQHGGILSKAYVEHVDATCSAIFPVVRDQQSLSSLPRLGKLGYMTAEDEMAYLSFGYDTQEGESDDNSQEDSKEEESEYCSEASESSQCSGHSTSSDEEDSEEDDGKSSGFLASIYDIEWPA